MGKRILVIDDEPENQLLIQVILEGEGFAVTLKDGGRQGIEAALEERFDLILLDVMMPDMNGFEVYERLRGDERTRDIPIIMLTALAQRKDYELAADAGVKDYVTKPFEPDELIGRVHQTLAHH